VALWCLLLFVAAPAAFAQPMSIELDPSKTKVEFTLADVLHTVHGAFKLKSGHIDFDSQSHAISGLVIVDAASGESGSGVRDGRMKKTILETDKYPDMSFAPISFEGKLSDASSPISVNGWFTIHGQRHPVTIPIKVEVTGDAFAASGDFIVPYVAWGMKNPSTLFLRVKDRVEIKITAVGKASRRAGPGSD
jgi:polyisoprenoid-binding protein YceI